MQNEVNPVKRYIFVEDKFGKFIGEIIPDPNHYDLLSITIIAEYFNTTKIWKTLSDTNSSYLTLLTPKELSRAEKITYYETYEEFIEAHFEHVL
jgi:hypothetical protein